MGAGGVIHNRAAVLLTAVTDPSLFDGLPQACKDKVNAIDAKAYVDRDEHDCHVLVKMIEIALHC
jgi:hypothetical protein